MYLTSIIMLIVAIIAYLFIEVNNLEVSKLYIKSDKLVNKFIGKKIIQISDLHGKSFGKNNDKLIQYIDREKPDVIFVTGDMIEANKKNYEPVYQLLKYLSEKYKVYYITGNHEHKAILKKNKDIYLEYFKKLKELNIIRVNNQKLVLDTDFNLVRRVSIKPEDRAKFVNEVEEIISEDNNKKQKKYRYFNLYGLILPFDTYRYIFSNREAKTVDYDYIVNKLGNLNKNECNMLLAHNPLYFEEYAKWGVDYVFSGHVHGGIIRLPKIGGLLSPERKFFPKHSFGEYTKDNTKMFVSKGLGGSAVKVRINCRPEIVSIKFI